MIHPDHAVTGGFEFFQVVTDLDHGPRLGPDLFNTCCTAPPKRFIAHRKSFIHQQNLRGPSSRNGES